jgi:hypothetical protein
MATCWFPDNSVIINFAIVDRLDLLRICLHGQGRVVEAVHYEIGQSQSRVPHLHKLDREDWFGDAIRIEDEHEQQAVESMRKSVSAVRTAIRASTLGRAKHCMSSGQTWHTRGACGSQKIVEPSELHRVWA